MNIETTTYQFAGLEPLKFEYTHLPGGLPTNHPARENYDDRQYKETIDPDTDTYWVYCKNEKELPIGHAEFGTSNSKLICLNVGIEPEYRRKKIASKIYDLVEQETERTIIPSNTKTSCAEAFWKAPLRHT